MNIYEFILLLAGTGCMSRGAIQLITDRAPRHHLQRERLHAKRRKRAQAMFNVGALLLMIAIVMKATR